MASSEDHTHGDANIPKPPPLPRITYRRFQASSTNPSSSSRLVPKETVETWERLFKEGIGADAFIVTDNYNHFPAHSCVLAAASPVIATLLDQSRGKNGKPYLKISGVPCDVVYTFIRFLYSSCYEEEEMKKFVLQLLVLSHCYSVPSLKRVCVEVLDQGWINKENVIDVLQLARDCDAERIGFLCVSMVIKDFKSISSTEGWKVMSHTNGRLEQELIEIAVEAELQKDERMKKLEERKVYLELYEAMEALVHIYREGCGTIGPRDKALKGSRVVCKYPACKVLEAAFRHFLGCTSRALCLQCKRMGQLLQLHSCICDDDHDYDSDSCNVPLCRNFKEKMKRLSEKEESMWRLLAENVIKARNSSRLFSSRRSGFISIDCGIPSGSSYTDDTTGINYVSDSSFVETGVSKSISFEAPRQLQNLRSFPEGSRNCYTLIPKQGKGKKYLIRTSFLYGNYDGESGSVFDLFLGGNIWDTVSLNNTPVPVTKEVVYFSQSENIFVCLGNKGKGTPFISTIELRFLGNDNTTYESPNGALFFSRRWDFGSFMESPVRYNDDVYDRIWIPRNFGSDYREINTSLPVISGNDGYSLPSLVMSTALTPTNTAKPITMILDNSDPKVRYFAYMHFAEVEDLSLKPNQTREFEIRINGVRIADVSPKYLQTETVFLKPESQTDIRFTLERTPKSTLPPIVNALEIYIGNSFSQSFTSKEDDDAATSIKASYKVKKNWQGDPCLPSVYIWEGLDCSYDSLTPPRITSLNLTSSGLTGRISPSFSNLTMIQELDLSNNGLTGDIPEFLSRLKFLRVLNLEKNKLTGSVPSELLERSKSGSLSFRFGDNQGLCTEIACVKSNKKTLVTAIGASCAALFILLLLSGVFWMINKRKKKSGIYPSFFNLSILSITVLIVKNFPCKVNSAVEKDADNGIRHSPAEKKLLFTFADVVKMTNNFGRVLGKGGFGTVYHGYYNNLQVAVKLLSETSAQGIKEFRSEVEVLGRVHHVNLTALIGYFHNAEKMGLVYEFMANGNMADHLAGKYDHTLSWTQRLQIALDAAQGLEYLHCGCKPAIVHRDVKTSNILLNDRNRAKLADFGLSRSFQTDSRSNVSTLVAGTPGYLDPLCFKTNGLNHKSDIYSFGVVLLEMITGKNAIDESQTERVHVSDWVVSILKSTNDVSNVVDSKLAKDFDPNSVWKIVELALASVSLNVSERPDMKQIVVGLKECLAREESCKNY
ncbi:unnamed protein product [Microthlaspi erraticum]|uniref:non-specific serine/threonine protein kinase n=1 Tax=Microthlaspi erraticum TaxID=1685480 RepID=A0A6D2ILG1_9BRAS|nr:unnamed protein product [Microthlaspi erraticum]